MEEDIEVIVAGAQLVCQDFELAVVVYHWEDILLEENETFASIPDYAAVEVNGLGVACCVESSELASADYFLGEHD